MKKTTNLALNKPEYQDESDIEILNENWDKIDINSLNLQTELDKKVNNSQVLTNVPEGAIFTDTITTKESIDLSNVDNIKQMPISGGEFTGEVKANSNSNYTSKQVRNIIFSTNAPDLSQMENGDIWIKYI